MGVGAREAGRARHGTTRVGGGSAAHAHVASFAGEVGRVEARLARLALARPSRVLEHAVRQKGETNREREGHSVGFGGCKV